MTFQTPSRLQSTRPGSGIGSRYRALLMTHRSLEEKLEAEMKRPLPDTAVLRRIKRRKLLIKDEMASIDRLLHVVRRHVEQERDVENGLPAADPARRQNRPPLRPARSYGPSNRAEAPEVAV